METDLELCQLQKLHLCEVTCCDLNVNYILAVGSRDKNVRILEWKVGLGFVDMFYSPLSIHKYPVTSVRFSPKGTILASASFDGTAALIDVLRGTKMFTVVQENTCSINFCEFTFDCTKLITAADDGMLCFWDLAHRRQIRRCRLHEEDYSLRSVAVSPDSEYLLSVDSGNLLKAWFIGDIVHDQPHCFLLKKDIHDDVLRCEFSPVKTVTGGIFLKLSYCIATCGADGFIKIWEVIIERRENSEANLESLKCHLRVTHTLNHSNNILSVRFDSRGNYIVSTGLNNVVKLWEVSGGNWLATLQGHARYVTSAAFSKDSLLLVTGSIDKTLIVWSLSKHLTLDSELLTPCNVSCHFTNINAASYHAGNSEADQAETYKEFAVVQKLTFPSAVNSVGFQSHNTLAVAGGQNAVEIWKKEGSRQMYEQKETLREHGSTVNHVEASSCGGRLISCSADGILVFWDLNMSLSYKLKTPNSTGGLRTCKFSPDSRYIVAAGDDHRVYLWDANNLEFLKTLQRHENTVTAVAFTPDGEFLATICGSDIVLQNLREHGDAATKVSSAHDLGILCCDFSSVSISDTERRSINVNSSGGDEGKYLLATGGNDPLVKLWEVSISGISSSSVLSGHGGTVNCVQFSSAEAFVLASCSSDAMVRIWDTISQSCLHVLNHHQLAVTTCSFSPDSTLLATGSLDRSVFILNLTSRPRREPKAQDQNSNKLLENWSPAEVAAWFLGIGHPELAAKIQKAQFSGRELLRTSDDSTGRLPELTGEEEKEFKISLLILKKSLSFPSGVSGKGKSVPHKFLCPITHQIMTEPVICTDGYTYDRAAITEWFLSGKLISPITRECLATTRLLPYSALKINIHKFLRQS